MFECELSEKILFLQKNPKILKLGILQNAAFDVISGNEFLYKEYFKTYFCTL